jgi:hypothetical protein
MRARNRCSVVGLASLLGSALWLLPAAMAAAPAPVHATWKALPIRAVVEQLCGPAGQPVVLDRRLDPTTPITLVAAGEPCDDVLAEIASRGGGQAIALASSIRIVPPAAAGRCLAAEQTRQREISRLPVAQREPLASEAACQWPAGSRPADLVAGWADVAGIVVEGLDRIPHDHFPAADLPPLSLADRFDLVLAHFDLRVAWSRGRAGSRPQGRIVSLPDAAPVAAVSKPSATPPRRPTRPQPAGTQQVYTLRLAAPLEEALAAITRQLGLRLDLDVASLAARGIAPREIARADVRSASRDELLAAMLKPLGLSWRIDDATLRVWAEPSPR